MKKAGNYKIPFVKNGRGVAYMLEYVPSWGVQPEWRDNEPFEATLELTGHWRGRSAARIGVRNAANREQYSMGLASFYDAVTTYGVVNGKMTGRWQFRKQGANYILCPVT